MSKREVADKILDKMAKLLPKPKSRRPTKI
jgi:hypothetical protein